MCQEETLNPVLHVLQDPAVSEFVPGCLHSQPIQALRGVVLDDLKERGKKIKRNTLIFLLCTD